MFCPRCGNQPNSNAMRYCASCGLRLEGVHQLLANDGFFAHEKNDEPQLTKPHKDKRKLGAKIIFASIALSPLFVGWSLVDQHPVPLFMLAAIFWTGVLTMVYAHYFGEKKLSADKNVVPNQQPVYLAPAQPEQIFSAPTIKTTEIEPPFSVVEPVTRQFFKEKA